MKKPAAILICLSFFSSFAISQTNKVELSGELCDIYSRLVKEAATSFKNIRGELIEKNADQGDKYFSAVQWKNADNEIRLGSFEALMGNFSTEDEAVTKLKEIQKKFNQCSKNYEMLPPVKQMIGSETRGYIIEKSGDSYNWGRSGAYTVNDEQTKKFRIKFYMNSMQPTTYYYIKNKPENSPFATSLKILIADSYNGFRKSMILDRTTYKYSYTFRLEGSQKSSHEFSGNDLGFSAVYADTLNNEEADKLFDELFNKLKKALGDNMNMRL
jgi:hypothetical protein